MAKEGYTRISHKLYQFMLKEPLNTAEMKVMLFLIRFTVGFHRKNVSASYTFIADGINTNRRTVIRAVKSLIDKGYVVVEAEGIGSKSQVLKLSTRCCQNCQQSVVKNVNTSVVTNDNKDNKAYKNFKENIKEITLEELAEQCAEEEWDD